MYSNLLGIFDGAIKFGYILIAILILMLMITIHEFGHYLAGKLLKFKINEFSIGFGKALYTKKKENGEIFSIRAIPLGGYCAFDGEDTPDESADSFNAQAPWKRLIVLFCGAFFNFLSAIIFNIALLAVIGNGYIMITDIKGVNNAPDKLQNGDIVTHINGEELSFFNGGIGGITQDIKIGDDITFTIKRNGEIQKVVVQKFAVLEDGSEVGKLGVNGQAYVRLSVGNAMLKSVPFTFEMSWEILVTFFDLLTGKYGIDALGGPVTTIGAMANAGATNWLNLLLWVPMIAANLAVFNLLPIPALDGSKMVFVAIEWVRGKPIDRDLENKIHMVGILVLFGIVILADGLHILDFFR